MSTPAWYKARRTWLWGLLIVLIAALLAALVWLIGVYEQARFEDKLEQNATELAGDIRSNLSRNAQHLQILTQRETPAWEWTAKELLGAHPEILRIELRDADLRIESSSNTPFLKKNTSQGIFEHLGRATFLSQVTHTCVLAARSSEPAYSLSYFVPLGDGTGYEITDMCLARVESGKVTGYLVATYSLDQILKEWVEPDLPRQQEISFIEADGTRLAAVGLSARNGNKFSVQSLLDLQGFTLVLRIESWLSAPYWLANTSTALVLALAAALGLVLWLLFRDMRKRLRTEAKLAREIIQQRKAEELSRQSLERLQRSARLATLGEMASMLSHELNQPLAAITSYATGSLNLLDTEPQALALVEVKTALSRIATQSARAGQVIKSVNDFVRRRDTERSYVAPQALFEAVLPLLRLQAKQLDVQLELRITQNLPPVWCDKTLVEQVIINLARNGMQAMGLPALNPRRTLRLLAIEHGPDDVEFQISDTGTGLAPEICDKLFTPFFTTKLEGTGLGLSLCRTVIEQHGGSLTYTTEIRPPLTGTTFSFKLMTHHATTS